LRAGDFLVSDIREWLVQQKYRCSEIGVIYDDKATALKRSATAPGSFLCGSKESLKPPAFPQNGSREHEVTNKRITEDIVIDLGEGDKIVGIEILDASKRVENPRSLEYAVAG
jgi:uncharacterized protein YuzE